VTCDPKYGLEHRNVTDEILYAMSPDKGAMSQTGERSRSDTSRAFCDLIFVSFLSPIWIHPADAFLHKKGIDNQKVLSSLHTFEAIFLKSEHKMSLSSLWSSWIHFNRIVRTL